MPIPLLAPSKAFLTFNPGANCNVMFSVPIEMAPGAHYRSILARPMRKRIPFLCWLISKRNPGNRCYRAIGLALPAFLGRQQNPACVTYNSTEVSLQGFHSQRRVLHFSETGQMALDISHMPAKSTKRGQSDKEAERPRCHFFPLAVSYLVGGSQQPCDKKESAAKPLDSETPVQTCGSV